MGKESLLGADLLPILDGLRDVGARVSIITDATHLDEHLLARGRHMSHDWATRQQGFEPKRSSQHPIEPVLALAIFRLGRAANDSSKGTMALTITRSL